jgi:hypothetical protein
MTHSRIESVEPADFKSLYNTFSLCHGATTKSGPKSLKAFQLLYTCQNLCHLSKRRVFHIHPIIQESDLTKSREGSHLPFSLC